uniref:hypothetical protein n=1 Tax=Streptomyces sp. NBC_01592 TaxID=2975889 RepID=UPI002F91A589
MRSGVANKQNRHERNTPTSRSTTAPEHHDRPPFWNAERAEADLADALNQLMRRARAGQATAQEQHLTARSTPTRTPRVPALRAPTP